MIDLLRDLAEDLHEVLVIGSTVAGALLAAAII